MGVLSNDDLGGNACRSGRRVGCGANAAARRIDVSGEFVEKAHGQGCI
jgi:hypothetical protein